MALEAAMGVLTFILLLSATLVSLAHVLGRLREGRRVMGDFTGLISVFIFGWFATEMLSALSRGSLWQIVDLAHLLVLVAFAVALTKRWKWAIKAATESLE